MISDKTPKADLPKRKHPRLKSYDYSLPGTYFITICTQDRRCVLSHIVGRGLAPAEAEVKLTKLGKIAENKLLLLPERYPFLEIDHYVTMPNHIHAIFRLQDNAAGASPRPTLTDIVCAYKSLTTKACKENGLVGKLFQTSFYEHVIRDNDDYTKIINYITSNPDHWGSDELFGDE